jgi:hypothetical protein
MFRTSLRSSQVRCEVQKFIVRFTNQFVNYAFDWLLLLQGLCLQIGLCISIWTSELRNEVRDISGQIFVKSTVIIIHQGKYLLKTSGGEQLIKLLALSTSQCVLFTVILKKVFNKRPIECRSMLQGTTYVLNLCLGLFGKDKLQGKPACWHDLSFKGHYSDCLVRLVIQEKSEILKNSAWPRWVYCRFWGFLNKWRVRI